MNRKPINPNVIRTLIVIVISLMMYLMSTAPTPNAAASTQSSDLHGSCVFAVQEWHNPEYINDPYCYIDHGVSNEISGTYVHVGDCGFDRYPFAFSGAGGYCYIEPGTPAKEEGGEPTNPIVTPETPIVTPETPVVTPETPVVTEPPVVVTPEPTQPTEEPTVEPQPEDDGKKHCNKGGGNGSEGCDPGNHPENGNDDETGEANPGNGNGNGHNN